MRPTTQPSFPSSRQPGLPSSRRPLVALLACLLLGWAAACAGPGGPRRVASEEEQRAYSAAIAHLPDDPATANAALREFLGSWPLSPLADDAAETLAQLALEGGRSQEAFDWLYYVVRNHPGEDRADPVRVKLARWEFERGNLADARTLLRLVRVGRLADADQRSYFRLLAELAETPLERLGPLVQLRAFAVADLAELAEPDAPRAERMRANLKRIEAEIDLLLRGLSVAELEQAAGQYKQRVPGGRIRLRLAERALESFDFERAQARLAEARRVELTPGDEELLASLQLRLELREQLADTARLLPTFREVSDLPRPLLAGASGSIGVVLPLSGRFASFGQESLRGVLLAAGIFDEIPVPQGPDAGAAPVPVGTAAPDVATEPGLRIVVRDSQGIPERAAAAVRELATDETIVAIIGPIFSEESEAAAVAAEESGVPLLTLSNREEVALERNQVFRLRTTPRDEVGFLVDYAFDELGARRFAVLYPRNRYGRGMRERYWESVTARGGRMVAVASYEPDATDFKKPIRSMIGYSLLTRNEERALEEREQLMRRWRRLDPDEAGMLREAAYSILGPEGQPLPPIVDFDVLFIPDAHDKIELIAPQLAFHEVRGVRLLGSSDWNHPDLVRIGREHVRGAVIATPFYAQSPFGFVRDFVGSFEARFATEPDVFSAHAFDATNLVLMQLVSGRDERLQVRDGILRVRGYAGVSGVISMTPDGNARKRPFLLQVRGGAIRGLD